MNIRAIVAEYVRDSLDMAQFVIAHSISSDEERCAATGESIAKYGAGGGQSSCDCPGRWNLVHDRLRKGNGLGIRYAKPLAQMDAAAEWIAVGPAAKIQEDGGPRPAQSRATCTKRRQST